ncbi:S-adenosyl-L-methionine-dependent methyltransferase [Coniochaeta sp. 2T2.1]|nr:S-adenosyl-L-methionine-dependent methyltransferase [Coniochaeta sp. 2T2.1]
MAAGPEPTTERSGEAPIEVGSHGDEASDLEPLEFDAESANTSITSSIYKHSYENGRRYHCYRDGKYPIPNDDIEQNREDMKHAMCLELTDGKLVFAPIGYNPQKVIDLGTGTGIWAIDFADKYPSAQVTGVDLSPIQPNWIPPNLKFVVDDVEDDWVAGSDFDLVYARNLAPLVKDFPKLLKRSIENIKPGGWLEVADFSANVDCDDGTMADNYPLKVFWDKVQDAMTIFGTEIRIAPRVGQLMEEAGFVNVQKKVFKVPVGTWPLDKTLRLVGLYMQTVTSDFLGAAGGKPFRTLGMSEEDIEVFLASVRKALASPGVHAYGRYYVWSGQKPERKGKGKE